MNKQNRPPALAHKILSWTLPERLRESILGDLEEERLALQAGNAWFWTQTLSIASRYLWKRLSKNLRPTTRTNQAISTETGDGIMQTIWNDLRYAARMLIRSPLFTIVCMLTLALAIGATTAIFSVVNALLIRPLPLPNSDRLVSMIGVDTEGGAQYISFPDFQDLARQSHLLEQLSAFVPQSVNLTGHAEPRRLRGAFVSDNFFDLIGVQPFLGRGFVANVDDREGADPVCILQYETWQNVFAGEPNITGKSIILNNEAFTVVGILPKAFRFPFDEPEVWVPHHFWPYYRSTLKDGSALSRSLGLVGPLARLKPDVTLDQAEKELKTVFERLSKQYPEGGKRSARLQTLRDVVVGDVRQIVLVLFGSVMFVLLIACTNVANLLLARAAVRQRELATRAALGAGRKRLAFQLFTETALLWVAGCACGLLVGKWGLSLLLAAAPDELPGGIVATLDATVFGFAIGVTAFTALLFGLIPALRFSSPNVMDAIKDGGRSASATGASARLRTALVIGQVALTLILIAGSALMFRSLQQLTNVNVGFQPQNLVTMEYRLPLNKYPEQAAQWQTHARIIEKIRLLPGVQSASLVGGLPFSGNGASAAFEILGRSASREALRARANTVATDYFRTMGIPVLQGRVFTENDRDGTPLVAVINQHMAQRFWPNESAVGRQIRLLVEGETIDLEVIGVVANTKQYGLDDPEMPYIYGAQAQNPGIFNTIVVRAKGDPMQMAASVRAAVWSVDPQQPVWKIRTQESLIERAMALPKFLTQLMACYAILALILAAVGIYGVMSYAVARRTYEIGVRMALGAQNGDVVRMILGYGLGVTCAGVLIGLAGALALGRAVQTLLFQTSASDPTTLAAAVAVLSIIALLACYLPARRASHVDPQLLLRYE